jgi:hypothetical protein
VAVCAFRLGGLEGHQALRSAQAASCGSLIGNADRLHLTAEYGGEASECLEVVALDHDPVRRLLPLDLLEPRHRPARGLGDPEGEGGRVVLPEDAVLGDVAVEVAELGMWAG